MNSKPFLATVADTLADAGVRHAFGLMSEETARLVGHLVDSAGVTYHPAYHEAGAVMMADGYAWASDRMGVALISRGPGFTNAATALTTAARGRRALLVVTGDNPTRLRFSPDNKAFDHEALAGLVGARFFRAADAACAVGALGRALECARSGKVAVLAVPADLFNAEAREQRRTPLRGGEQRDRRVPPAPGDGDLLPVVELIMRASRPLVLAGAGALAPRARAGLERLAERVGALLGTSILAKGAFNGHPLDVGVVGGYCTDPAAELLSEVDCVVAFGASLNKWTTGHGALSRRAKLIQIDCESKAIGRFTPVELGVVGDAADVATRLLELVPPDHHAPPLSARDRARLAATPYAGPDEGTDDAADPRALVARLDELFPASRTIVTDGGHAQGFPAMYMRVPGAGHFRLTVDFSSIGLALATAIGVAVARPASTTVCFTGDGALLMGLGELQTAARSGLPLVVVVMNDRAYGAERHYLDHEGASHQLALLPDVDFAAIGSALGIESFTLRSAAEVSRCAHRLAQPTGPVLLDCKVRPDIRGRWFDDILRGRVSGPSYTVS